MAQKCVMGCEGFVDADSRCAMCEVEADAQLARETADWCDEMDACLRERPGFAVAANPEALRAWVDATVARLHAVAFPQGCPNGCEACVSRLGGAR